MVGEKGASELERHIDEELVRLAVGTRLQYADGVPFAIVIAIALCGAFPSLGVARPLYATLWVLSEVTFAIAGVCEWHRYQRRSEVIPAREQELRLAALWTFHGLVWGSVVPIFWNSTNATNESILCTIVLGVMVGSFFMLSPVRAVFAANLLAVVGVAEIAFVVKGGALALTLSIILPLFTAMIVRYGWTLASKYEQAVRLHLQNEQMANSLNVAVARAENASKAKSQFLANMSHELRTPLNAILGFSEMIASRSMVKNVEKHFEYAELIHRSAHHFLALINDILDLAKIEAGSFTLRESDVDLAQLIQDSLALMEAKAEQGGVALKCETPVNGCHVRGDERALKQIMLNLLSNALKFTPAQGSVVAFVSCEENGAITFGVRDTGVGIALEDQARVFENFGQGRHDVVTADKGTGLGLPIVKGLAEAHGGSVSLNSRVGEGTLVSVRLPADRVHSAYRLAS